MPTVRAIISDAGRRRRLHGVIAAVRCKLGQVRGTGFDTYPGTATIRSRVNPVSWCLLNFLFNLPRDTSGNDIPKNRREEQRQEKNSAKKAVVSPMRPRRRIPAVNSRRKKTRALIPQRRAVADHKTPPPQPRGSQQSRG